MHRSVGPALGCAAGCRTRVALATVQQLRLHMGMRHPHDALQMVEMQRSELDQMHEMFLGLPLAADEEHVSCLTIFTDGSASLDAAWPRRRTAAGWGAVVLQGKPGAEQRLIGVMSGQVILNRDHLHFLGATTRTVSTAEITGTAISEAYLCFVQEIVFMVDSRHAMGVLSRKMRAIANAELVQNGRALISRLSECTVVQWRPVASHAVNVNNELAGGVAALASRGAVVSAIGPLPRRESRGASQAPCPVAGGAERFWTNVMMKPDPKLFVFHGKMRTSRPMVMRWGSANVLTVHEGVGLAADREKGLSASARRLDLEAQFNASGYSIVGLQETRCRRERDRRGTSLSHDWHGCKRYWSGQMRTLDHSETQPSQERHHSCCAQSQMASGQMLSCQIFLLPLSLPTRHQRLPMSLSRSNGGKNSRRLSCAWLKDVGRFGCS